MLVSSKKFKLEGFYSRDGGVDISMFDGCAGIGNVNGGARCLAIEKSVPETDDDFSRAAKVKA